MSDFLLEIGTEEIPARMIASATDELQRRIAELITRERLSSTATVEAFSSPRRIAVGGPHGPAQVDDPLTWQSILGRVNES